MRVLTAWAIARARSLIWARAAFSDPACPSWRVEEARQILRRSHNPKDKELADGPE